MTSHGLGQPGLIQKVCVSVQFSEGMERLPRDCSRLAEPFVEAMGESGLISCSNALHFLAVGSAVGSWSASLEARYTSSCVPGESLEAVWDLSCSPAGTARSRQMCASVTVTSHQPLWSYCSRNAALKHLSHEQSK